MKLHIQKAERCDREVLRTLLIDAADQLAGEGSCLLELRLPWDGNLILLADTRARPILISFDPDNSQAALINGLQAADRLAIALPWANKVYAPLQNRQETLKLIVISDDAPPGSDAVLAGNPGLTLFTCKVLRVNDDLGVLLKRIDRPIVRSDLAAVPTPEPAESTQAGVPVDETLPSLSPEERLYFRQL